VHKVRRKCTDFLFASKIFCQFFDVRHTKTSKNKKHLLTNWDKFISQIKINISEMEINELILICETIILIREKSNPNL